MIAEGLKERAKIRLNQQRRLEHACETIAQLIKLHMPGDLGEREIAEIHMMQLRLTTLIKHQHVINKDFQVKLVEAEGY